MSSLPESSGLLILPRLRIQNANTISSPMTHGFPSITAFLGLMWALERKLADHDQPVGCDSVGVICHGYQQQVTKDSFVHTFCLTRNPVDKTGGTAAIVEEGRIHLDITLIFGISGDIVTQDENMRMKFAQFVGNTLAQMRVAGGTVLSRPAEHRWHRPRLERIPDDATDAHRWFRLLRRSWLPGFALVSRDDLLDRAMERMRSENPSATKLEAWLNLSRFNWQPHRVEHQDANTGEITRTTIKWTHDRTEGWIVPIPVGYGALSELYPSGAVANARGSHTPFRFVESLYSVGQWISPHRIDSWKKLLWYGDADIHSGLYRARNDYAFV